MDDASRVVGMGLTNPFVFEEPSRLDDIMCGGSGWGFDSVSEVSDSTIISGGYSDTMKIIVVKI